MMSKEDHARILSAGERRRREPPMCDHEWEFIDESFDHEFGREPLHTWECQSCGETTHKCPFTNEP